MPIGQTLFPIHAEDLVLFPRVTLGSEEFAIVEDGFGHQYHLPVQPYPLGIEVVGIDGITRDWVRDGTGRFATQDSLGATHYLTTQVS